MIFLKKLKKMFTSLVVFTVFCSNLNAISDNIDKNNFDLIQTNNKKDNQKHKKVASSNSKLTILLNLLILSSSCAALYYFWPDIQQSCFEENEKKMQEILKMSEELDGKIKSQNLPPDIESKFYALLKVLRENQGYSELKKLLLADDLKTEAENMICQAENSDINKEILNSWPKNLPRWQIAYKILYYLNDSENETFRELINEMAEKPKTEEKVIFLELLNRAVPANQLIFGRSISALAFAYGLLEITVRRMEKGELQFHEIYVNDKIIKNNSITLGQNFIENVDILGILAYKGKIDIIKNLEEKYFEKCNRPGALAIAAARGHEDIVQLILPKVNNFELGNQKCLKSRTSGTPSDWARLYGFNKIADLIDGNAGSLSKS
jgi:hypothetical protein